MFAVLDVDIRVLLSILLVLPAFEFTLYFDLCVSIIVEFAFTMEFMSMPYMLNWVIAIHVASCSDLLVLTHASL